MNHFVAYQRLVAKATARVCPEGYVERHHILPKALGGSDDSSNLVAMTAREHFLAHILLAKMHGGDMWLPVVRMKTFKDGTKANSRLYEMGKIANALEVGKRLKGSKLSNEHKMKIGQSSKGQKRSTKTRRKISEALKNKPKSEQHRKSLAGAILGSKRLEPSPLAGRKQSADHVAKRAAAIRASSGKNNA